MACDVDGIRLRERSEAIQVPPFVDCYTRCAGSQ